MILKRKFLLSILLAFTLIVGLHTSINAEEDVDDRNVILNDAEIRELLNLYNAVYYGAVDNPDYYESNKNYVTEKDIEEFKRNVYSPITRAGETYSTFFNSTKWITRSGVVSLSINYKTKGMYPSSLPNANAAASQKAWQILLKRHKGDKQWKNTTSMYNQFLCHAVTIGQYKNPWNIEPHRTETSFTKTVAAGCNP